MSAAPPTDTSAPSGEAPPPDLEAGEPEAGDPEVGDKSNRGRSLTALREFGRCPADRYGGGALFQVRAACARTSAVAAGEGSAGLKPPGAGADADADADAAAADNKGWKWCAMVDIVVPPTELPPSPMLSRLSPPAG